VPSGTALPGGLFFIWLIWLSTSWVTMRSEKRAVKTQNMTRPKPTMPMVESKSRP